MQSALKTLDGVASSEVNLKAKTVHVRFDSAGVTPDAIAQTVTDSGFDATVK